VYKKAVLLQHAVTEG